MFIRALIAFLALPGMFAGVVPALISRFDPWRMAGTSAGYGFLVLGLSLLLWCVQDFYVSGKGTLAPWHPPRHLVVVGLCGFVRNPMYISVLCILAGWCLTTGSALLAVYITLAAMAFHFSVTHFEERWAQRDFGADWTAYAGAVRRWIPRTTGWSRSANRRGSDSPD